MPRERAHHSIGEATMNPGRCKASSHTCTRGMRRLAWGETIMTNTINRTGLALVLALAVGALAATFGLFGSDGPTSVSAQTDTTAPTVSSVAITSDPDDDAQSGVFFTGVYGIGDSIQVTATFSEDVTVTGGPRLALDIGGLCQDRCVRECRWKCGGLQLYGCRRGLRF